MIAVGLGLSQGWSRHFAKIEGIPILSFFGKKETLPRILMFLGWGVAGIKRSLASVFGGGGNSGVTYVTTYSDGSQTTSRGSADLFWEIAKFLFQYIISPPIVFFKTVALSPAGLKVANIAVLIGAFVFAVVINFSGQAAERTEQGIATTGNVRYSVNAEGIGIIIEEYAGFSSGKVVIPSEIDGLPVVGIKSFADGFFTSVVIPDTVTYIGSYAFSGNVKLKQITLPKNLKYIGSNTFKECGLTSIVIPEGVTDIGNAAFINCSKLKSVTLPQSLERIGELAFRECTSLVEFNIPTNKKIIYGGYYDERKTQRDTYINEMGKYFIASQSEDMSAFIGCVMLSAASKKTITDSGYKYFNEVTITTKVKTTLREGPDNKAPRARFRDIPAGDAVIILEKGQKDIYNHEWVKVLHNGAAGWIPAKDLNE
jgi:hypothetical protein